MATITYNYSNLIANGVTPTAVVANGTQIYRLIANGTDIIHKIITYSGTIRFGIRYTFERTVRTEIEDTCYPTTYYYYTMHLKKIEMCRYSYTGDLPTIALSSYTQVITQYYGAGNKSLTTLNFSSSVSLSASYQTIWSGDIATQEGNNINVTTSIILAAPTFSFTLTANGSSTTHTRSNSISSTSATSTTTTARTESTAFSWSKEVQEY